MTMFNVRLLCGLLVGLLMVGQKYISAEENVESLMKKTVDFDAPIIRSEDVLSMLQQLKALVPIDNSPVQFDLENLINYSVMSPEKCTKKFDEEQQLLREPNNVSSPNRDKKWGPNIMAYFRFFKVKAFQYCVEELRQNVQQISSDDENELDEIIKSINTSQFETVDDFKKLNVDEIFEGVSKHMRDNNKNFDKLMQKSKTRQEAHEIYEKDVSVLCERVLQAIEPLDFVFKASMTQDFPKELFDNQDLKDWLIKHYACFVIKRTELKNFDRYYFGDKGIPVEKVPFWKRPTGAFYGSSGSSGYGGLGLMSMAAVASSMN